MDFLKVLWNIFKFEIYMNWYNTLILVNIVMNILNHLTGHTNYNLYNLLFSLKWIIVILYLKMHKLSFKKSVLIFYFGMERAVFLFPFFLVSQGVYMVGICKTQLFDYCACFMCRFFNCPSLESIELAQQLITTSSE